MALNAAQLKLSEHVRNVFAVTLSADQTLQDTARPEFWAHTAARLRPRDRIEVTAVDGSWFAELFVTSVSKNAARIAVLRYVEIKTAVAPTGADIPVVEKPESEAAYFRRWNAKTQEHEIIRNADKEIVDSLKEKTVADARVTELIALG